MTRELSGKKIEWKFNLERAPWWRRFFERMVECVKRCLPKVLDNARLTFDELFCVIQKLGFINEVDNVNWPPYRDYN